MIIVRVPILTESFVLHNLHASQETFRGQKRVFRTCAEERVEFQQPINSVRKRTQK